MTTALVQKKKTLEDYLKQAAPQIARVIPQQLSADRLMRIALSALSRNPKLLECTPASVLQAVMLSAQLGLEPNALGHSYFVPFENRKLGIVECVFIPGYRGLIDLAKRGGDIVDIEARAVYAGDDFKFEYGLLPLLHHVPDFNAEERTDKDVIAVYAVASLKDSTVRPFDVMSRKEIDRIRSKSRSANNGPWVTDFVEMARKTVVRRFVKYLPLTIEAANAIQVEDNGEAGERKLNAGTDLKGLEDIGIDLPEEPKQSKADKLADALKDEPDEPAPIETPKAPETAAPEVPSDEEVAAKLDSIKEKQAAAEMAAAEKEENAEPWKKDPRFNPALKEKK